MMKFEQNRDYAPLKVLIIFSLAADIIKFSYTRVKIEFIRHLLLTRFNLVYIVHFNAFSLTNKSTEDIIHVC